MILRKIEIEQFAGLKNYILKLTPGVQYLYGENEAGKSTLCAFISAMFYGLPAKVRGGGLRGDSRRLYMPWGETYMAGTVYFTHQGKDYVLKRRFGQTSRSDRCSLYFGDDWQEMPISPEEIGPKFLGVGEEAFYKTLFISQLGAAIEKGKEDELLTRLSNLEQSGEEDASVQKAIDELTRARHELISKSGQAGVLPKLRAEEAALQTELKEVYKRHEDYRSLLIEIQALSAKRDETESKLCKLKEQRARAIFYDAYINRKKARDKRVALIEELNRSQESLAALEADLFSVAEQFKRLAPVANLGQDILLKLAEKEAEAKVLSHRLSEIEALQQKLTQEIGEKEPEKPGKNMSFLLFALGVLLLLSGVVCGVLLSSAFYLLGVAGLGLGLVAMLAGLNKRKERQGEQIAHRAAVQMQLQKLLESEPAPLLESIREEMQNVFHKTETDSIHSLSAKIEEARGIRHRQEILQQEKKVLVKQIGELKKQLETFPEVPEEEPIYYDGPPVDSLSAMLETENESQLARERELARKTALAESGFQGLRSAAVIENELAVIEERIAEFTFTHEAIRQAEEFLNQCAEELKKTFAPALNEKAGKFIEKLSEGRYREVRITDTYQMMLKSPAGIDIVEAEYVSAGTWDMLYYALRLSLVDTLYESAPLLILDDTFVQLDADRQQAAFALLEESGAEQILYFSCHEPPAFCNANEIIRLQKPGA